jgi:RimJ/RimL family protein N-acetyltransferase
MEIRVLTEADADEFWSLRLRALQDDPEAFGASYEEAVTTPIANVIQRLRDANMAPDNLILGAFEEDLVGMVGFRREPGDKLRHKAVIWGMYVVPEARGQGIARALLYNVLARAISIADLEQINLSVVTTNGAARRLYLSLGFEVYGLERRALKVNDQYLDEEHMVLFLS